MSEPRSKSTPTPKRRPRATAAGARTGDLFAHAPSKDPVTAAEDAKIGTRRRSKKKEAPLTPAGRQLLLGWRSDDSTRGPIGFKPEAKPVEDVSGDQPVYVGDDRHLLTIAPTGAGKGRGIIIPNLLRYEGSVIVIDPKGETWHTTRRRRREMGHEVHVLDPFSVVGQATDSLNPFDLFDRPGALIDADAEMLATLLAGEQTALKEPFWDNWGRSLMAGVIAAVAETATPSTRSFAKVRELLMSDDAAYNLAALLDSHPRLNRLSRQNISAFLPITDQTRSGILSTSQSYLKVFNSDSALRSLIRSTIDLSAVRDGAPTTIYIIVPPEKLESHGSLMRLWVGALLLTVMSRKRRPERPTLFLLDEAAQLGEFGPLRQAMTLLRGYGLQVWPFFQDLSQLQSLYKNDWRTIYNNAGVFQMFGIANNLMARESSDLIGDLDADTLRALPKTRQAVAIASEKAFTCRLPDYLTDEAFKGMWDPNPMFELQKPKPVEIETSAPATPAQEEPSDPPPKPPEGFTP
jgi:type IV secretion system protein VirD4